MTSEEEEEPSAEERKRDVMPKMEVDTDNVRAWEVTTCALNLMEDIMRMGKDDCECENRVPWKREKEYDFPISLLLFPIQILCESQNSFNVTMVHRFVRAGAVVVGTTAGSQRRGTRSTSGIARSVARAIVTTEFVAEAAKNTLGSFCKKQQRTAASAAAAKAPEC